MTGKTLTSPLLPLLGRESELQHLLQDVQAGARLLTLTGPGGVGKTRLALEVQGRLQKQHTVHFVDLSQAFERPLAELQVLRSLEGQEGLPLSEALHRVLQDRPMLLILDNLEQVQGLAEGLQPLLEAHPALQILGTSRQALGLRCEHLHPLSPFDLPEQDAPLSSLALQFLVREVARQRPGFEVGEHNLPDLIRLCQQLDGLPLAMELIAARARLMSVPAMLQAFDRLTTASSGQRDLPTRQQSLEAVASWSEDLLDPDTRRFFWKLGVFSGPLTLQQTESLFPEHADTLLAWLDQLCQSHLVVPLLEAAEPTFQLLVTLRHHATQRLQQQGELFLLQERHQHWCIEMLHRWEPEFKGPRQAEVFQEVGQHDHHHQAALQWALSHKSNVQVGLQWAQHINLMQFYWYQRGHLNEGQYWLQQVLNAGLPLPRDLHIKLLNALSNMYGQQGRLHESVAQLRRALQLFDGETPPLLQATIYNNLGIRLQATGLLPEARTWLEEGMVLHQQQNFTDGILRSFNNLGHLLVESGELERAEQVLQEGIDLARLHGRQDLLGLLIQNMGLLASQQGNLPLQVQCFQEAATLSRSSGYVWGEACNHINIANVLLDGDCSTEVQENLDAAQHLLARHPLEDLRSHHALQQGRLHALLGHKERAHRSYLIALQHAEKMTQGLAIASVVNQLIDLLAGQPEVQAHLLGFLQAQLQREPVAWGAIETRRMERNQQGVQAQLDPRIWQDNLQAGQACSLYALRLMLQNICLDATPVPEPLHPQAAPGEPCPLTPKEKQVLQGLAAGLSNKQLARQLGISDITVRHHVSHIFSKLGCNNRARAVTLAMGQGWLEATSPTERQ